MEGGFRASGPVVGTSVTMGSITAASATVGTLAVTLGDTTLNHLTMTGDSDLQGHDLVKTGTIHGNNGIVRIGDTALVNGDLHAAHVVVDSLAVTYDSSLGGDVTAGGDLTVAGEATLQQVSATALSLNGGPLTNARDITPDSGNTVLLHGTLDMTGHSIINTPQGSVFVQYGAASVGDMWLTVGGTGLSAPVQLQPGTALAALFPLPFAVQQVHAKVLFPGDVQLPAPFVFQIGAFPFLRPTAWTPRTRPSRRKWTSRRTSATAWLRRLRRPCHFRSPLATSLASGSSPERSKKTSSRPSWSHIPA